MADIFRYDDDVEPRPAFPWPPAAGAGPVAAFGETWRAATFDPSRFFRHLPRTAGTAPAVLYYLIVGMLLAGANLFWDVLAARTGNGEERLAELGLQVDPLVTFLLSPLLLLLGLLVAAGVTHLMLLILRGANHSFGTTARVFAYAYSPMIFGVVPVLGTVVGALWMLVLAILGLAAAHDTPAWKPVLAVLLPFALLMGLLVFVIVLIVAAGAAIVA